MKCRFILVIVLIIGAHPVFSQKMMPVIGKAWQIADDPDLGKFNSEAQQPVDFGIWQADDGSWQLWSCIRGTKVGGKTRLLFRWQADKLSDTAWKPQEIAMRADTSLGETDGGLQAPFVLKDGKSYHLFYGDWESICHAESADGKIFKRQTNASNKSAMFSEGKGNNTRDPMVIRTSTGFNCYYTAFPHDLGAVYMRSSKDLRQWSEPKIVAFGGSAGTGKFSAECPFVYFDRSSGNYFLFRTQRYGQDAQTSVYQSKDPENFGVNDDRYLITTLPIAAPEIISYHGELYIASLLPTLKGIQLSTLKFEKK